MTCLICRHGETHPGLVTVTLQQGDSTVIIKEVPAAVCENCGEYYLDEEVTHDLLQRAQTAVDHGAEVEIIRYAA